MHPATRLLATAILSGSLAGCATLPHPTGPEAPAWRDARLLEPSPASRLVIEIDRVEGTSPRPLALRRFMKRLAHYLDKPDGIELVIDDVIPADRYEENDGAIRALAAQSRSVARKPGRDTAVAHVLYAPRYRRYRGYAWSRPIMARQAPGYDAPLILILQGQLRSILWITGVTQEASVLTHEFGHALGLVGDPGHGMNGHCTNAWCSMYDGVDARTLLLYFFPTLLTGYLPTSFCRDCTLDLYPDHDGRPPGARR